MKRLQFLLPFQQETRAFAGGQAIHCGQGRGGCFFDLGQKRLIHRQSLGRQGQGFGQPMFYLTRQPIGLAARAGHDHPLQRFSRPLERIEWAAR